jgi:hypothetical protein
MLAQVGVAEQESAARGMHCRARECRHQMLRDQPRPRVTRDESSDAIECERRVKAKGRWHQT